jgi:hypothetical protein
MGYLSRCQRLALEEVAKLCGDEALLSVVEIAQSIGKSRRKIVSAKKRSIER